SSAWFLLDRSARRRAPHEHAAVVPTAPAEERAVTPGADHRGIRRALIRDVSSRDGLPGSSGREGTADSPVEGRTLMNADDLKKRTTESLKELAFLLEQGRSERLTSLLKTMARFHRYSLHNICLIV